MNQRAEHKKNSYQIAADMFRTRNYEGALESLVAAIECGELSDSEKIKAGRLRADIMVAKGDYSAAVQAIDMVLDAIRPGDSIYLPVALHRAAVHIRAGDMAGAVELDIEWLLRCNDVQILAQAGYIFTLCERHAEALNFYRAALLLEPDNSQLLFNTATACRAMGQLAEAESLYDKAISLNPADWEAYKNRSDLRTQTVDSNHIKQLKEQALLDSLPAQAKVQLNFAIAKELEDLGCFDESFEYLEKGCAARRAVLRYSLEKDLDTIDSIAKTFNSHFFDATLGAEEPSIGQGEGLIFVLGMPRTGTTLVDRMLTSTPGVVSVGEPDTFARLLSEAVSKSRHGFPDNKSTFVRASAEINFSRLGRRYQEQMMARARKANAEIILDKNPMNFLYVGLIHKALPNAKIVHLCRNPMDTCYAIYKTLFKTAYPYSYSQEELAHYYLAYRNLMAHWHSLLPGKVYDLEYESLVESPEEEARQLLEFCELPWNGSVLEFYRRKDHGTATASAAQVRQPVYRSSVGKWKNYSVQLSTIENILSASGISF